MNANKGNSTEVLDPFAIQAGWFVLDVASLYVRPEAALQPQLKAGVKRSIEVLKLNDEPWVRMRFDLFRSYIDGGCTLAYLQRYYPFIAVEIQRQGVQPRA
jgi:hypothetical protein